MNDQVDTGITFPDILVLHEVAKLAAERGAIKANEMSVVGAAFDRVSKFISVIRDQEAAKKAKIEETVSE